MLCVLWLSSVLITHTAIAAPLQSASPNCPSSSPQTVYPDTTSCDSYYSCQEGVAVLTQCPPGQVFYASLTSCQQPFSFACVPLGFKCPSSTGIFADKSDCSHYYQCTDSVAFWVICSPGKYFSVTNSTCSSSSPAACSVSSISPPSFTNQPPIPPVSGQPPVPPVSGQPPVPPVSGLPPVPPVSGQPPVPPVSGLPPVPPVSGLPPVPPVSGLPPVPPVSGQPTAVSQATQAVVSEVSEVSQASVTGVTEVTQTEVSEVNAISEVSEVSQASVTGVTEVTQSAASEVSEVSAVSEVSEVSEVSQAIATGVTEVTQSAASEVSEVSGISGVSEVTAASGVSKVPLTKVPQVSGAISGLPVSGVSLETGAGSEGRTHGPVGAVRGEVLTVTALPVSAVSGVSEESAVSGVTGVSGVSEMSAGVSAVSGVSEVSAVSGVTGISGVSEVSAVSGVSEVSAVSGVTGVSGVSEVSAGVSAVSGVSGVSGVSEVTQISVSGVSGVSAVSGVTEVPVTGASQETGTRVSGHSLSPPAGPRCPSNNQTFYPDTKSCVNYYECIDGVPHKRFCPPLQVFYAMASNCDWPFIMGCEPLGFVCPPSSVSPMGTDKGEFSLHADILDCSHYYQCSGGIAFWLQCPSGFYFNWMTHSCSSFDVFACIPGGTTESPGASGSGSGVSGDFIG